MENESEDAIIPDYLNGKDVKIRITKRMANETEIEYLVVGIYNEPSGRDHIFTLEESKLLEQDLKDLGKWRRYKGLKKDLEN